MKTAFKLHFRSLLSAHTGQPSNPYLPTSANWYAWEAVEKMRRQGREVIDVWMGRGTSVNVRTPDSVTSIAIL